MNKVDAKLGMKVESTANHDYEYKIVKIKPTGCTVAVVTEGSEKGNIFKNVRYSILKPSES